MSSDVTRILSAIEQGDPSASEQLLPPSEVSQVVQPGAEGSRKAAKAQRRRLSGVLPFFPLCVFAAWREKKIGG
jgi:hypothetical protein